MTEDISITSEQLYDCIVSFHLVQHNAVNAINQSFSLLDGKNENLTYEQNHELHKILSSYDHDALQKKAGYLKKKLK